MILLHPEVYEFLAPPAGMLLKIHNVPARESKDPDFAGIAYIITSLQHVIVSADGEYEFFHYSDIDGEWVWSPTFLT
jgi:hypothetical protein